MPTPHSIPPNPIQPPPYQPFDKVNSAGYQYPQPISIPVSRPTSNPTSTPQSLGFDSQQSSTGYDFPSLQRTKERDEGEKDGYYVSKAPLVVEDRWDGDDFSSNWKCKQDVAYSVVEEGNEVPKCGPWC